MSSPTVLEDVCKMNFSFSRELNYQHPRTTMLMFGPKNAPTKQTHYLCLPFDASENKESFTMDNIGKSKMNKFAILFITQFDGVPMADVFKVLQYQFYETIPDTNQCTVRIGLQMHYIKSSMFKGQIMSGTKEELGSQIASWLDYVKKRSSSSGPVVVKTITTGGPVAAGSQSTAAGGAISAAGPTSVSTGPPPDLTTQVLTAVMNNIPVLVFFAFALLFFFLHIWYTNRQIVILSKRMDDLQAFQQKFLVELINDFSNKNGNCTAGVGR